MLLAALPSCGSAPAAKPPDTAAGAPLSDVQRLYPLEDNTVFSYATTDDSGQTGIYVMEVTRPRQDLAELKVAGKVFRRYIAADGVKAASGGYVLRSPVAVGSAWKGEFGDVSVKSTSRAIKVPAGSFDNCVETLESAQTATYTKSATSVFCPGVGMVYYMIQGEEDDTTVSQKLELKTFGPRFVAGM